VWAADAAARRSRLSPSPSFRGLFPLRHATDFDARPRAPVSCY
jgi:hypothetical protein